MKFDQFEARLNQLLDERRGWESDAEICRLIEDSAEHRALAMSYSEAVDRQTLERLFPLPAAAAPGELAQRVLAALRTASPVGIGDDYGTSTEQTAQAGQVDLLTTARSGRLAAAMALAATVLLAVGLSQWRPQPHAEQPAIAQAPAAGDATAEAIAPVPQLPGPDAIAASTDDEASQPQTEDSPDEETIGALVHEVRDKYADLARDTQQAMSEVALLLPGFSGRSSARRGNATEPTAERPNDWAGQVGDGLEPLTRSTVGALDFILQSLPGRPGEPRS